MDPWNHNNHYHPVLLAALPPGCGRALDVGCGEGLLARRLRERVPHVTGIDAHEPSVRRARAADPEGLVDLVVGDVMTHPFEPGSFDAITCVAALHHLDSAAALQRMADLLAPGGRLAVLGLARTGWGRDLLWDAAGIVLHRVGLWRHARRSRPAPGSAPTPATGSVVAAAGPGGPPILWPPPYTYAQVRRLAERVLPGVRYRRHALFRYSLVWTKPGP